MAIEIEHKYLIKDNSYKQLAKACKHILQGYISIDKERTVRVRISDDKAYITIKGKSNNASRLEYEYEIPKSEAQSLLENICLKPIIEKYRYIVPYEGFTWEIDEFRGTLNGLILGEIELCSESTRYTCPSFVGRNVTGDIRYYNSNLSFADCIPEEY